MTMRTSALLAAALMTAALLPVSADENKRQATRAVIAGCQSLARGDANESPLQQGYCMGMVQAVAVTNGYAPPAKKFCPFPPSLVVKD